MERFDQIVVRAVVQSGDSGVYRVSSRENQDRRSRACVAHLTTEVHAITVGQAQVENDEIVLVIHDESLGGFGGLCDVNRVRLLSKPFREHTNREGFVLNQQQAHEPIVAELGPNRPVI